MSPSLTLRSSQPDGEDRQENWKSQNDAVCAISNGSCCLQSPSPKTGSPPFSSPEMQTMPHPWHQCQAGPELSSAVLLWSPASTADASMPRDLCLGLSCIPALQEGSWTEDANSGQRLMEENYVRLNPHRHPWRWGGGEENAGAVLATCPCTPIMVSSENCTPRRGTLKRTHQPWCTPTPSMTQSPPWDLGGFVLTHTANSQSIAIPLVLCLLLLLCRHSQGDSGEHYHTAPSCKQLMRPDVPVSADSLGSLAGTFPSKPCSPTGKCSLNTYRVLRAVSTRSVVSRALLSFSKIRTRHLHLHQTNRENKCQVPCIQPF